MGEPERNKRERLDLLPVGEVVPTGWMRSQMIRDYEQGFLGCLDRLTRRAVPEHFGERQISGYRTDRQGKRRLAPRAWWNGESEAVWMDGLVRMALLTGHPDALDRSHRYIEYLLRHQSRDGYIGVYQPQSRYRHSGENGELWTQSRALRVMLAYYEATRETDVLDAVVRAVELTRSKYGAGRSYFGVPDGKGGTAHGLMYVDVLEWLHRIAGERKHIEFAEFLYRDYSDRFTAEHFTDAKLTNLLDADRPLLGHTPHATEHLRVPVWLSLVTENPEYERAWQNGLAKLLRYTVPSGAVHSGEEEHIQGFEPTPEMPYEYCGITEFANTLQSLVEKTGRMEYADLAEWLVMNAGQGARLADGRAANYFARDNRREATSEGCGGRLKFSPTHEDVAVCCNPNAGKLMPYHVGGMWMKLAGRAGLAALHYGPCDLTTRIEGVRVRVEQDTDYPFSHEVRFTVTADRPVAFPLRLRAPNWAEKVEVDAPSRRVMEGGDCRVIDKRWEGTETFTVRFDTSVGSIEAANGERALRLGPLLYALPIADRRRITKSYAVPGFADQNIVAAGDVPDDCGIRTSNGGLDGAYRAIRRDRSSEYPWESPPLALEGPVTRPDGSESFETFLPFGATVLRRLTFHPADSEDQRTDEPDRSRR